jgi:hypothetical protein
MSDKLSEATERDAMRDNLSEATTLAVERYGLSYHLVNISLDIAITAMVEGASPENAYRAASITILQLPTDEKAAEEPDAIEDFLVALREWINFLVILRDRYLICEISDNTDPDPKGSTS